MTPDRDWGLFAIQAIPKGNRVITFDGPIVPADHVGDKYQVGANTFMGPDGTVADAINHSCSPSVWIDPGKPGTGYALRPIAAGEELTFDYALNHTTDERFFKCKCGAINCRKTVSGFGSVPRWQQLRYLQLQVVPQYVLDYYLPSLLG